MQIHVKIYLIRVLFLDKGVLQFTTLVSAAFWLVNIPTWMLNDSLPMLDKLFRYKYFI